MFQSKMVCAMIFMLWLVFMKQSNYAVIVQVSRPSLARQSIFMESEIYANLNFVAPCSWTGCCLVLCTSYRLMVFWISEKHASYTQMCFPRRYRSRHEKHETKHFLFCVLKIPYGNRSIFSDLIFQYYRRRSTYLFFLCPAWNCVYLIYVLFIY